MAKRIVDGKTYNTETATCLGAVPQHPQDIGMFDELYQTRYGAYFRYHGDFSLSDHKGPLENLDPLSPSEAQIWMEKNAPAALVEKHFGQQPEAGESESRITFRLPDALKNKIETLAAAQNQSLNSWLMRCVETCAMHQAEQQTGSTEILRLLAEHDGSYILDELGAPHRDDLKLRTVSLKLANGGTVELLGAGGPQILGDFIRASLVYEAVPLNEKYQRVYRLTPEGLRRGRA